MEETYIPEKSISKELYLEIKMKMCFIDFEGLTDGRSMKHILTQINPKKLVSIYPEFLFEKKGGIISFLDLNTWRS
jgi:hypothetical protein